jgi:Amt family ammonium transporter
VTCPRLFTKTGLRYALALIPLLAPALGYAQDDVPALDTGDTAWMLTATVLVLFMTIPGLALFYAGLVRSKNVLSVLMQCFAVTALMTILWTVY